MKSLQQSPAPTEVNAILRELNRNVSVLRLRQHDGLVNSVRSALICGLRKNERR